MSGRTALILLVPVGLIGIAGVLVGGLAGWDHLLAAGLAIVVTVPPGFGSYVLTRWLMTISPYGGLLGMMIGIFGRLLVAVGGGAAFYLMLSPMGELKLGFWIWLLASYLSVLAVETVLQAKAVLPTTGAEKGS